MTLLVAILFAAAEIDTFEKGSTFELDKCHKDDTAMVFIEPMFPATNRVGGSFKTKKDVLTYGDLSMSPDGTNRIFVQIFCAGKTSSISGMVFIYARKSEQQEKPEPPAPKIRFRKKPLPVTLVSPPLPFGFPVQPLESAREANRLGMMTTNPPAKFILHRSQ